MTQKEVIVFLSKNGMNIENMSYNEINCIISIANKVAEESFKECLLTFCKINCLKSLKGE